MIVTHQAHDPQGDLYCWSCNKFYSVEDVESKSIEQLVEECCDLACPDCHSHLFGQLGTPLDLRLAELLGTNHRMKFNTLISRAKIQKEESMIGA